jgi:hypothetical protein
MPAGDLFELTDLPSWLQVPAVDTETATRVRRWASGWLETATGITTPWPSPVPNNLWAWGIELAGIAFRNPDAASSQSIDEYSVSYDRARRKEILDTAARTYSGVNTPLYSFPEPDWHWTVVPVVPSILQ